MEHIGQVPGLDIVVALSREIPHGIVLAATDYAAAGMTVLTVATLLVLALRWRQWG